MGREGGTEVGHAEWPPTAAQSHAPRWTAWGLRCGTWKQLAHATDISVRMLHGLRVTLVALASLKDLSATVEH
jgi:hypothetical protein